MTAAALPGRGSIFQVEIPVELPDRAFADGDAALFAELDGGGFAVFATGGLYALSFAHDPVSALLAETAWGFGVCYFWPTMLGITGRPHSTDGKRIEPLQRFGLKLMSIGFLLDEPKQAIIWRGPMLHGALQQFVNDVDWGDLDYLVMDLPPGTGDVALTLAQKVKVTGAVVVTTPQEVALADVYKGVSLCQKVNIPILGVVENMSFFIDSAGVKQEIFGSGGGQKVAEYAKAPLLGQIPIDSLVREWGDKGTPVVQASPESAAGQAFAAVADALATLIAKQHYDRTGKETAPATEGRKRLKIMR
mgnify:CR=1 FL=1